MSDATLASVPAFATYAERWRWEQDQFAKIADLVAANAALLRALLADHGTLIKQGGATETLRSLEDLEAGFRRLATQLLPLRMQPPAGTA